MNIRCHHACTDNWLIPIVSILFVVGTTAYARPVDILLAIPFSDTQLSRIQTEIAAFQSETEKQSVLNGVPFYTEFSPSDSLHITLEAAKNVDSNLLAKYETCVRTISQNYEPFDITESTRKATIGAFGENSFSAAVELSTSPNEPLVRLREELRKCFESKKLSVSSYPEFRAHITFGRFQGKKSY